MIIYFSVEIAYSRVCCAIVAALLANTYIINHVIANRTKCDEAIWRIIQNHSCKGTCGSC